MDALYGPKKITLFAHEYMGMPAALALEIAKQEKNRRGDTTLFYAHEVSTARAVVESHPGHDFSFYNLLQLAKKRGGSLEKDFGNFDHSPRHALVRRASQLNHLFAVSDITKEEYLYLAPETPPQKIDIVYNGITVAKASYPEKERARDLLQTYAETLCGFRPDFIFTHVTRLVRSKGLWRDLRILHFLDSLFASKKLKGFYLLLATQVGEGRPPELVHQMEADYGWPVTHHEGWPDLIGDEVEVYRHLKAFNMQSKTIQGVYLNQFGFESTSCGKKMPASLNLKMLRMGSDMELGLSIYEPFGIAPLETLPYGGIPVVSRTSGCAGLLEKTLGSREYLTIDFTKVPTRFREQFRDRDDFLKTTQHLRDQIETEECRRGAEQIFKRLPKTDKGRRLRFEIHQRKSTALDWEHVAARIATLIPSI